MHGTRERRARELAGRLGQGWTVLIDWRGLLVLERNGPRAHVLPHGTGVVFGAVFEGGEPNRSVSDDAEASARSFATERWGAYVAVVVDRLHDVVHVLRDPTGAHACYCAGIGDIRVFFTDAEDFIRMAPETSANFDFVRAFLRYPKVAVRETGLGGVKEVFPGECVSIGRTSMQRRMLWSPSRVGSSARRPAFDAAGARIRAAAELCVEARTRGDGNVVHRLSGGFDSAVVLGLMAKTKPADAIVCVNEFWPEAPEGDERPLARHVVEAHGVRLVELAMDPARVDYERTLAAPLTAKPTLAVLSFADLETALAYASFGGGLLTSGQGGDHVFHRSRTSWIAADAVRDGLSVSQCVKIACDTARLTRTSVWRVFGAMVGHGLLRRRPAFLKQSGVMGVLRDQPAPSSLESHAWLAGVEKAPPASGYRIWQLIDALGYHDVSALSARIECAPVLLSQPVIEACLDTPPYVMTAGGKERALARAAFADVVPASVLARSAKGETTRYFAAILARNACFIREALADGELVSGGVIEREKMARALNRDWRQDGLAADGLYALVSAEVWLRNLRRVKECVRA